MPSPEHFHERRPKETPPTSPRMQAVITDLAAYYEVAITQAGAHFSFVRPEQDKHWVIANLDGQHIDVARCPVEDDIFMVPDIDLLFALTPNGWQTMSVVHTDAVWEAYVKAVSDQGQQRGEPAMDFPFGAFAEYVADLIETETRLEQASDGEAVKEWLTLE
jgi:hypothetical protein